MESVVKNRIPFLKEKTFILNVTNPNKLSFHFLLRSSFVINELKLTNPFLKVKQENQLDTFSPTETRLLSLGGNKRFSKVLDECSLSLTDPNIEYKYLTIAVHYYISLLRLDVDKFAGKPVDKTHVNN